MSSTTRAATAAQQPWHSFPATLTRSTSILQHLTTRIPRNSCWTPLHMSLVTFWVLDMSMPRLKVVPCRSERGTTALSWATIVRSALFSRVIVMDWRIFTHTTTRLNWRKCLSQISDLNSWRGIEEGPNGYGYLNLAQFIMEWIKVTLDWKSSAHVRSAVFPREYHIWRLKELDQAAE